MLNYNFACFFNGCETSYLKLRDECRLRVFEKRVVRRIFSLRGTRWQGSGENYIVRSLTICNSNPIFFR